MSNELRVVAVIQAAPGKERAVAEAIAACVAPSRAEPGCREYVPHRDLQQPGRFVFVERWSDRAALAAHEQTAHFQTLAKALTPLIEGELQVLLLEELA
ncbi:putative quinol monooxygenase [Azotobacter vinelandii]|uniref:putative quinol monooxygenase n=1 Tax=Azotobacter vinelandii TaxID=354 RepID=UPI0026670ED2|nr:putative quinol monooxygenase [Azotobacter vinelandii]WKN20424.1 antibiotic biosynthesis monooxygenase [Azotobacter vinelandii]